MRIITGSARGLTLKVPKNVSRPTTDKVRGAMFSMLGDFVHDARVLDLFAGSGALGLEALSRGAANAVFVDDSRGACAAIESNLAKAKFDNGRVVHSQVKRYLKGSARDGAFNLVFADPPYDSELRQQLLDSKLAERCADYAVLIFDAPADDVPPDDHPEWELLEHRHYGLSAIWMLQKR